MDIRAMSSLIDLRLTNDTSLRSLTFTAFLGLNISCFLVRCAYVKAVPLGTRSVANPYRVCINEFLSRAMRGICSKANSAHSRTFGFVTFSLITDIQLSALVSILVDPIIKRAVSGEIFNRS